MSSQIDSLADAWLRYQTVALTRDERALDGHPDFDAVMATSALARNQPAAAISFIQGVLCRTEDEELLAILAAGPLEDLLVYHGPEVIERIENLSRNDDKFRQLLFGVWRNEIDSSTWNRLEAIRTEH
ncbi:MAG TPA: hypothetical protein VMK12_11375 [Anaeromyxobacteraceae bacterium]|nr:hypothetical protein [Anaeromyxobacteraceae bacterium]